MPALVDTSVIVAAERARRALVDTVGPETDIAISVMTAVELWGGVEYSAGARQRRRREDRVLRLLAQLRPLPLDGETAVTAAQLSVDLERQGRRIPMPDLLIAATAIVSERTLVTTDARHFPRVEGLDLRLIETV